MRCRSAMMALRVTSPIAHYISTFKYIGEILGENASMRYNKGRKYFTSNKGIVAV
jgi:hypothetical protein